MVNSSEIDMADTVACVVQVDGDAPANIDAAKSRLGASMVFLSGPMHLPGLRSKMPVRASDNAAPGFEFTEDDSSLKAAIDAARSAGIEVFLVVSNPLVGRSNWTDLLARDNGGRSAAEIDPQRPVLCPNRPKLIKWLRAAVDEAQRTYKPAGFLLQDFALGFPDRLDSLFTCWCETCQNRATELGYDPDRMRLGLQGVRSKLIEARPGIEAVRKVGISQFVEALGYDMGILDWLNFRADSISALLYEIRQTLSSKEGTQLAVMCKAPTVSGFLGQRRADVVRDTTVADHYLPIVAGVGSGVMQALAVHAGIVRNWLPSLDEKSVSELAAGLLGYSGSPDDFAVCERELALALAHKSDVRVWPCIDTSGLSASAVARLADSVKASEATGLVYHGVPA